MGDTKVKEKSNSKKTIKEDKEIEEYEREKKEKKVEEELDELERELKETIEGISEEEGETESEESDEGDYYHLEELIRIGMRLDDCIERIMEDRLKIFRKQKERRQITKDKINMKD